jgi:hypothetical protein
MASLCVLNILRVSAWSDAVSIPCLGWQSFVLLHEYFDPSATGKDLAIDVIVRVTQWTCMLQERHENARRMLGIWEVKAPLVMLGHSS